jgi:transcriptional regulator with XRE-family HTH domain
MTHEIDIEEFAAQIRRQRGNRGLREIAQEIGEISASTLSRIENGNIPDLDTFIRVCRWLGLSPDTFIIGGTNVDVSQVSSESESKKTLIKAHLRADRTLDPKTAEALVRMIELAYEQAERGDITETS